MYIIIRIVLGCVFFGCSFAVINKSQIIRKHILHVVFLAISIAVITLSAFVPFENLLITFDSPKDAYEYYNFGKSDIQLIVEGDNCDFVINRKNGVDTYLIIPKTAEGWKIGLGSNTKRIVQKLSNGITVYVYQYKNTSDYFITILNTNGGEAIVSDVYNTKFHSLEKKNEFIGKTFITYYAHVPVYNPQYSIVVNGNEIRTGDGSTS